MNNDLNNIKKNISKELNIKYETFKILFSDTYNFILMNILKNNEKIVYYTLNVTRGHPTYNSPIQYELSDTLCSDINILVNKYGINKLNNKKIKCDERQENKIDINDIDNLNECQKKMCKKLDNFLKIKNKKIELLINGEAGSGKTFAIITYLNHYRKRFIKKKYDYIFVAPTHQALHILTKKAKNIVDDKLTLAQLLSKQATYNDDGNLVFTGNGLSYKITERLKYNNIIIIIDEVSMLGDDLYYTLIEHIKKYTDNKNKIKLIYLGDSNQLPPIEKNYEKFRILLGDIFLNKQIGNDKYTYEQNEKILDTIMKYYPHNNNKIACVFDIKNKIILNENMRSGSEVIENIYFYFQNNIDNKNSFNNIIHKYINKYPNTLIKINYFDIKKIINENIKNIGCDNLKYITFTNNDRGKINDLIKRCHVGENENLKYPLNTNIIINDTFNTIIYNDDTCKNEKYIYYNNNTFVVYHIKKNDFYCKFLSKSIIRYTLKLKNNENEYSLLSIVETKYYDIYKMIFNIIQKTLKNIIKNKVINYIPINKKKLCDCNICLKKNKKLNSDFICISCYKKIERYFIKYKEIKDKHGNERKIFDVNDIWNIFYSEKYNYLPPIDYNYAISSYKSQGSTYSIIIVNINNIVNTCRDDFRKSRASYVSVSRAQDKIYFIF